MGGSTAGSIDSTDDEDCLDHTTIFRDVRARSTAGSRGGHQGLTSWVAGTHSAWGLLALELWLPDSPPPPSAPAQFRRVMRESLSADLPSGERIAALCARAEQQVRFSHLLLTQAPVGTGCDRAREGSIFWAQELLRVNEQ